MKSTYKLPLVALVLSTFGAGAAMADDQQLPARLAMQRAQSEPVQRSTTVAVYAGQRGLGRQNDSGNTAPETRFEWRQTAHGSGYGAYVQGS